jgi:hypothetical protein
LPNKKITAVKGFQRLYFLPGNGKKSLFGKMYINLFSFQISTQKRKNNQVKKKNMKVIMKTIIFEVKDFLSVLLRTVNNK